MSSKSSPSDFNMRFLFLSDQDIGIDCEFIVIGATTDEVIIGHKLLFAAASQVFRAMFYGDLKENKTVTITDLDSDGFRGMKHFIYTGAVDFKSARHALSTYLAARKYLIPQLVAECKDFIEQNLIKPSEVLEFLECCKSHNISEFEEICFQVIENKTDEVVESEYFPRAEFDTIIELILASPSLKLKSELDLFRYYEKWVSQQNLTYLIALGLLGVEKIATDFNCLKKYIRFLTMTADEFISNVEESSLLTIDEKYAIIRNIVKFDSVKPFPQTLSSELQKRNFIQNESFFYPHQIELDYWFGSTQRFKLPGTFFGVNLEFAVIASGGDDRSLLFNCEYSAPESNVSNKVLIFKTKVFVMGEKRCTDKLLFEKACEINVLKNCYEKSKEIAEIPVCKLRNNSSSFLRNNGRSVKLCLKYKVEIAK